MIGIQSMFGVNAYNRFGAFGMGGLNRGTGSAFLPNYSQLNDLRMITSLYNKKGTFGSSRPNNSISSFKKQTSSFLREYQNRMSDTLQKANALRGKKAENSLNALGVVSSDRSKVTAEAKTPLRDTSVSYQVNVKRVATEQMNLSRSYSKGSNTGMSGILNIQGTKGYLSLDVGSVGGRNNAEKLNNIAKAVNKQSARTGVGAMVLEDGKGRRQLALYGQETGEGQDFTVSGSFARNTGLDKAAVTAGNAEYTVDSGSGPEEFTSASNTVLIGGGAIKAALQDKGESTLSVGRDPGKAADGVRDLVKSYNRTVEFLSGNASRGTGVTQQMRRMASPLLRTKSMQDIGVSANRDGTLSFDRDKFESAMAERPSYVMDKISGDYGLAETVSSAANAGMNISSSRLTNGMSPRFSSLGMQQMYNSFQYNPLNTMGSYNRNGIFDVFNYNSAGALMSLNI